MVSMSPIIVSAVCLGGLLVGLVLGWFVPDEPDSEAITRRTHARPAS